MEENQPLQTTQPATAQIPTPPGPLSTPMDNLPNTSPPPRHIPKVALILISLIIVAVLTLGGAMMFKNMGTSKPLPTPTIVIQTSPTPTPDPTADWKTYTNQDLALSLKYPNDWKYGVYTVDGDRVHGVISLKKQDDSENSVSPGRVVLYYYDNSEKLSLQDYETKFTGNSGFGPGVYTANAVEKRLGSYSFRFINDAACEPLICDRYVITNENKIYVFLAFHDTNPESTEISEKRKIVDQILSTFKFTDSISATCTPRPACLDATPKCMIPETSEMCPLKITVCTMEAKQCPDGSYVSRIEPNCEFSACPGQ